MEDLFQVFTGGCGLFFSRRAPLPLSMHLSV